MSGKMSFPLGNLKVSSRMEKDVLWLKKLEMANNLVCKKIEMRTVCLSEYVYQAEGLKNEKRKRKEKKRREKTQKNDNVTAGS